MKLFASIFILAISFSFILTGCSQVQVPDYPGAAEDQEHEATLFGMTFGKVRRVVTDDSYDAVFSYYMDALEVHNPDVISHTLEDGRQGAITIKKGRNRSITVAIQEFRAEGKTAITYMSAGSEGAGILSLLITWLMGLFFP